MGKTEELNELLAGLAESLEKLNEELAGMKERVKVVEDRQDVYQDMLKEGERAEAGWQPIPKEKYPADYANDKKNKWVTVTPLKDGEVRVVAKGVPFMVEFKQGQTMGTYSTFADNARSRGIVP